MRGASIIFQLKRKKPDRAGILKLNRAARWVYGITQVCIFLLIMAMAAFTAIAGWLMLEPREIPELTRAIETSLNKENGAHRIHISKAILALGEIEHPLEVIIADASLNTRAGEKVLKIPTLQISLNVWALLLGKVVPEKIALLDPYLSVYQDEEGVFYLSGEESLKAIALRELFSSTATQEKDTALIAEHIPELDIIGGNLHFVSKLNKMKLDVPSATVVLRQSDGVFRGRADIKALQKGKEDAELDAYFTYDPAGYDATIRLDFSALQLSTYAEVIPQLAAFKEIQLPLTGMIEASLHLPDSLMKLEVNIRDEGKGTFRYEPYFMRKMTVTEFSLKGQYDAEKKQAKLKHFEYASRKGAKIFAEGEWLEDENSHTAVKGRVEVTGMSKKLLINLWPVGVGMNPRKWIDESILNAFIPHANIVLNAPAGALELEELPEETITGRIDVQNAEVNYTEGFPHVKNANGVVELTGNTLTAKLQSATTLDETKLIGEGKVHIASLVAEDTPIIIDLPLSTTARDVLHFMKSTPYKLPTSVNLNPETMSGNLFGDVHVNVLDKPSPKEDDVTFNIVMDAKVFNQPKFYKGLDVTKVFGKIRATDRDFYVDATGQLDGQRMQLEALMKKEGEDYHLKAILPHDRLLTFGIQTEPYLTGPLGMDLKWQERYGKGSQFQAELDIDAAELKIEDVKYLKDIGTKGMLKLEGTGDSLGYHISDFMLQIPDRKDSLRGSVNLSPGGEIKEVNLSQIDFAGTKGKALYRPIPDGYYVRASGEVLDLSYRDDEKEKPKNNPLRAVDDFLPKPELKIPALDVEMKFNRAVTSKDGQKKLENVSFQAQCNKEICRSMNLSGSAEGVPFSMLIEYQNKKRVLTSYTSNAGVVLRHMNLFDDMKDGEMQITGIFQDELPTHPLVGKLVIGPHRVKDVPLLTKLLTVATFTGIVDILSGEGLMFQKCEMPFRKENMVIRLEDAKSVGPSIGLTVQGDVDLNQDTLNLKGVVIPAYMFNAMIRSIPVLGNIFGALAGDGLVAVNYSMKGNLDDPAVSVNPLSALTPGFLRGFFSIFDTDDAGTAKKKEATRQALDKFQTEIDAVKVHKTESTKQPGTIPEKVSEEDKVETLPVTGSSSTLQKRRRRH